MLTIEQEQRFDVTNFEYASYCNEGRHEINKDRVMAFIRSNQNQLIQMLNQLSVELLTQPVGTIVE